MNRRPGTYMTGETSFLPRSILLLGVKLRRLGLCQGKNVLLHIGDRPRASALTAGGALLRCLTFRPGRRS